MCFADTAFARSLGNNQELQWDLFVSQAVVHSSDNDFWGKSDDSLGFDHREVGFRIGGVFKKRYGMDFPILIQGV